MALCVCSTPLRPSGDEPERLAPWVCLTCGGYACEYAPQGRKKCPPSICDCFIDQYPDSPRDLHPEAFIVGLPRDDERTDDGAQR